MIPAFIDDASNGGSDPGSYAEALLFPHGFRVAGEALAHCAECNLWLRPHEGCLHIPAPAPHAGQRARRRGEATPIPPAPAAHLSIPHSASPVAALRTVRNEHGSGGPKRHSGAAQG